MRRTTPSFAQPIERRTLLKAGLASAAVQIASPLVISARGEAAVKMGMVEPLTGVYAKLAEAEVEGARLALEEVNQQRRHSRPAGSASGRGFRKRHRHRRRKNPAADRARSSRFHSRRPELGCCARHDAGDGREAQAPHRHRWTYRRNHRQAVQLERLSHLQDRHDGSQRDRRYADREIRQDDGIF